MSYTPQIPVPVKENASTIVKEAESVIESYFGRRLKQQYTANEDGVKFEDVERNEIIISLAMKMREQEILDSLNTKRKAAGLNPINLRNLSYYRKRYGELIDEVWMTCFTRITEIYSFTDKLYRLARYDELAKLAHQNVLPDFQSGVVTDLSLKKGNFFLKLMLAINTEMGDVDYNKMIKHGKPLSDPEEEQIADKNDISAMVKAAINDKFGGQLPDVISKKYTFSDYTNCAFAEKLGESFTCWNDKASDKNQGSQCSVQSDKIQVCSCFMNKSLLDNKDFLTRAKERHNTAKDIAVLVGLAPENYDDDARAKVIYYLKKHDIEVKTDHPNKEVVIEQEENATEQSEDSETD